MKRKEFLTLAAVLSAAGILTACGQRNGIVDAPITENEIIAASVPDAVSIAEDTMDYPYLDATADAIEALSRVSGGEESLLDTFGDTHPGLSYTMLVSYLPSQAQAISEEYGGPVAAVALPNATSMTAQQAANQAAAIFHVFWPERVPCTSTLLCACSDETDPGHQVWKAYLICAEECEPQDYYVIYLTLDAITGKLLYLSFSGYETDGTPRLALRGEDAISDAMPQAAESLTALLAAAGAGQQLGEAAVYHEAGTHYTYEGTRLTKKESYDVEPRYLLTELDGTRYLVGLWDDGTVRYLNTEEAYLRYRSE